MRDIKFRAWDGKKMHLEGIGITYDGEIVTKWESLTDIAYDNGLDEVMLMQYSGLYDCKCKEICNGDIIIVGGFLYEVEEIFCCVGISTKNGFKILSDYATSTKDGLTSKCSIVGNIYENKELLETK